MSSATNNIKLTSSRPYLVRALLDWIVDNGLTPYILVNADIAGVRVPRQHVKDGRIVLNISPTATSHFELNNAKLQFKAGFGSSIFEVLMPIRAIEAIYARENGQGMSFNMGIPGDEGDDDGGDGGESLEFTEKPEAPAEEKPKRPQLKIVK
ncbi:MAG: ClpXP protease specificity-enhancing factor [Gammaproteobacteria bacterium]